MAAQAQDMKMPREQMQEMADLLNISRQLYNEPYHNYNRPLVAPLSRMQQEAAQAAEMRGPAVQNFANAEQMIRNANKRFPHEYRQYMNPYEQSVIEGTARDINRNFSENILPTLEAHFIKRGQHGSSKHRDLVRRAQRDMQSELASKVGQLRAHGYETGAKIFNEEQKREAELSNLLSNLATSRQASDISHVGLLSELGQTQQQHNQNVLNNAYQQWLREKAFPYEKLERRQALFQGLPYQSSNTIQFAKPPTQELNRAGNIGALAAMLLAARHRGGHTGNSLGGMFG